MPPIEYTSRTATIQVWDWLAYDQYGQTKVAAVPVEMKVHLVINRADATDEKGGPITRSLTISGMPRSIEIGSIVWVGEAKDLPVGTNFSATDGLLQVDNYDEVPDLKGRISHRTCKLSRYKDVLPRFVT